MHAEQLGIAAFLAVHPPFDTLPPEALDALAQRVEVTYRKAGERILEHGEEIEDLYVVRSGAVETYRQTGELYNRLAEGGLFGEMGLLLNGRARFEVRAIEDTLLYCIPAEVFRDYCARFPDFSEYFATDRSTILRQAVSSQAGSNDLVSARVTQLIGREPVMLPTTASIREAAVLMTEQGVSSLLIVDALDSGTRPDEASGRLVGILTDRDLRKRVLAVDKPLDTPVTEVMSSDPVVLETSDYVFEAIIIMLRYNLHHLPIVDNQRPVGVVALSDVLRHEAQSSLLLVRGIFSRNSIEDLQRLAAEVPAVFVRMVGDDANSHMIGSAMSMIGRAFMQRLLELAEAESGPPPVPYCFLSLGSMARNEQLIVTDQDNAMILDNAYDPAEHGAYFERLAAFVSDGLAACGYRYCDGDIMATNPEWRMTYAQWEGCFADWIDNPNPRRLLNASIFFDLEGVYGELKWAEQLQSFIAGRTRGNLKFLAQLARNALNRTPPLGFFKGFVLEKDGRHGQSMNLKRRGTAPLTDLVRVHALGVGSEAQNSFSRIDDVTRSGLLPDGKARDLADALEVISMVRIRHQAANLEAGQTPDNNIDPESLSSFERRNLKHAFQSVDNAQKFLKYRYNASMRQGA